ncbi:MAG: heavy-metal-associated domain-containing protein [Desulfobulbaceae bacterium]|nr:heavy-metal-associated domain-containing protein [Desulfobulbaceae bacterium]
MYKHFIAILIGVALTLSLSNGSFAADEKMTEVKIETSAYSFMCKNRIETELKNLKGVEDSYLNLDDKIVTIKYNPNTVKPNEMMKVIKNMGYDADILKN